MKIPNILKDFVFVNDISHIDLDEAQRIVKTNSHFSYSYVILLIGSSIVTTLGLLVGSAPVVIGGMIISPLMWPLLHLSIGISFNRISFVRHAMRLLIISILISFIATILITYISPFQDLNSEILTRTNPTLFDIVIALVSGMIASLCLVQPRISQNLAGVAIATSLTPPICVSGISLTLQNYDLAINSFLLFFANVIAIVFIAIVTFSFVGLKNHEGHDAKLFKNRSLIVVTIFLVATAIPVYVLMRDFIEQNALNSTAQTTLTQTLAEISPDIELDSLQSTLITQEGLRTLDLQAEILLEDDVVIDYRDKQLLIARVENAISIPVNLSFTLTRNVQIKTENLDIERNTEILETSLINQIQSQDTFLEIENIRVTPRESVNGSTEWFVTATLRGDLNTIFTENQRESIETALDTLVSGVVRLDVTILPQIRLQSSSEIEADMVESRMRIAFESLLQNLTISENIEIMSAQIKPSSSNSQIIQANAQMNIDPNVKIHSSDISSIRRNLRSQFPGYDFHIKLDIFERVVLRSNSEEFPAPLTFESEQIIIDESLIENQPNDDSDLQR